MIQTILESMNGKNMELVTSNLATVKIPCKRRFLAPVQICMIDLTTLKVFNLM